MVHTALDVVNLGLAKVGADQIDALDENTPLGAFASTQYAPKRAYCVSRYRWTFSEVLAALQQTDLPADAPAKFAYLPPPDASGSMYAFRRRPCRGARGGDPIIPEQIDGLIFSDVNPLYVEYEHGVAESLWPAPVVEMVATAFASDVAGFLQRFPQQKDLDVVAFGDPREFPMRDGGLYMAAIVEDAKNAPQRYLNQVDGGPLVAVRPVAGGFLGLFGFQQDIEFVPPPGDA